LFAPVFKVVIESQERKFCAAHQCLLLTLLEKLAVVIKISSDIMQGINAWLLRLCALAPHHMQNGDRQQGTLIGSCDAWLQPFTAKTASKSNALVAMHPSVHLPMPCV